MNVATDASRDPLPTRRTSNGTHTCTMTFGTIFEPDRNSEARWLEVSC